MQFSKFDLGHLNLIRATDISQSLARHPCSLCNDLSDNLTETSIVKNSNVNLSVPHNIFSLQLCVLCFLAEMLLFTERDQFHTKSIPDMFPFYLEVIKL